MTKQLPLSLPPKDAVALILNLPNFNVDNIEIIPALSQESKYNLFTDDGVIDSKHKQLYDLYIARENMSEALLELIDIENVTKVNISEIKELMKNQDEYYANKFSF